MIEVSFKDLISTVTLQSRWTLPQAAPTFLAMVPWCPKTGWDQTLLNDIKYLTVHFEPRSAFVLVDKA